MISVDEALSYVFTDSIIIHALAELKDFNIELYNNSMDTCVSAVSLAKSYDLGDSSILAIARASVLHNVGKLRIPLDILRCTNTLDDVQFGIYKLHPLYSAEWIMKNMNDSLAASIVLTHHEYPDGSGYPFGLSGNLLSLESRVVNVADDFTTLKSSSNSILLDKMSEHRISMFKNKSISDLSEVINDK